MLQSEYGVFGSFPWSVVFFFSLGPRDFGDPGSTIWQQVCITRDMAGGEEESPHLSQSLPAFSYCPLEKSTAVQEPSQNDNLPIGHRHNNSTCRQVRSTPHALHGRVRPFSRCQSTMVEPAMQVNARLTKAEEVAGFACLFLRLLTLPCLI